MSTAPVEHASFTIERHLHAPPALVYEAWSTPQAKARWFTGSEGEWNQDLREMDFRVGGREQVIGTWASGMVSHFDARYHVIQAERLIVYTYDMYVDGNLISVSVATVEIHAGAKADTSRLRFTEQVTVLDARYPAAGREAGSHALLDRLTASLPANDR
jgi:uncharacterized protein YndB with AHSA1/START domain